MLAIAWPWDSAGNDTHQRLADRLASSLCSGIGGDAGAAEACGIHFAYRPIRPTGFHARSWCPATLPSGRLVVFNGYFDNFAEVASALERPSLDATSLYGLAVEKWGDEAEDRIIGEYCAVIADPRTLSLRLSRSPLRAPPLYYHHGHHLTVAASVPRVLLAAGVQSTLNDSHFVDSALVNYSNDEETAFEQVAKVPTGTVVELQRGSRRDLRRWYNLRNVPPQKVESDAAVLAKVDELLNEGVRACLAGFARPGATLSGGLDTPQVALRALAALPPNRKLPTFTFHPAPEFDGPAPRWMLANERPLVEAFASLHPALEPHFTSNPGHAQDYRLNELFHLIGDAPPYLGTMYVYHGLLSEASRQRCDVLLLAEFGNRTFSDKGDCGFVEYFLKGKWRQLWLALTRPSIHKGSVFERLLVRTLSAFLPLSLWLLLRRVIVPDRWPLIDVVQPFSPAYRVSSGANERQKRSGYFSGRYQPWSRRHSREYLFGHDDWLFELYQGFEQMYGVAIRDPTSYRPFVEYCLGLPTKMFMRDGELRWLAKQMAKGIMPEDQRQNRLSGWWDADWHDRIGSRRSDWLAELDRLEQDERFAGMLDFPRLRDALEDWPTETETDPRKFSGPQIAVPAALVTTRFINYVEGRNTR